MNNRDSRFECLRLVAIFFVVVHHLLLFGANCCGYLSDFSPSLSSVAGVLINSVVVTGVSLFVMITGWFGARRVWRPMLRLVVECAVFGAAALFLGLFLQDVLGLGIAHLRFSWNLLWQSAKFTNWWFIVHYLMLLLCAPLLEAALEGIERKGVERILLCLLVFNIVFGFWWGYVNKTGYNVVQFVLLYVLARYMRLCPDAPAVSFVRRRAWLVIAACALGMSAVFLVDKSGWRAGCMPMVWNYNDPFVILEAMAVFSLFTRSNIRSGRINFVARYVLGIYLLQSAPALYLFRNAAGRWAFRMGEDIAPLGGYFCLLVLAIAICVVGWGVSWALMSVLRRPFALFTNKGVPESGGQ